VAGTALLTGVGVSLAQTPDTTAPATTQTTPDTSAAQAPAQTPAPAATTDGGTIHGTVKAGNIPLPGVAITATNTLTGKKFATTTDVDGNYSMTIPKTGRYVVRAELAAFASITHEVRLTADAANGTAEFGMELASKVAAATAASNAAAGGGQGATVAVATLAAGLGGARGTRSAAQGRGTQALNAEAADTDLSDATTAASSTDPSVPSLGGLGGGDASGMSNDSVAVIGNQGQTTQMANMSEDQLRQNIQDRMNQVGQQGGNQNDQLNAVVSMLAPMMGFGGGPGGGGPGGGGGGARGGGRGGAGGGGGGAFRNFNPAQPHGSIFYQGADNALNSASWQPSLVPQVNPSGFQNRFGASIAGTPYIPGLTKPDTRQFVFINLTGQKNLNSFAPNPVRVPTAAERAGNFSATTYNGAPVVIDDPTTGQPFGGTVCLTAPTTIGCNVIPANRISQQAMNLLNYYPHCNINYPVCDGVGGSTDLSTYNYQTVSNSGNNNVAINARYQRQLGQQTGQGPFGRGGGGGGRGGGGQRGNANAPPVLRQSINAQYNYSHAASDIRNIFLPLGGATETNGYGLILGHTISYGRLSNNATLNWNRSNTLQRNYFTDTANNPTTTAGLSIPNQASNFANPNFYNGLPSINLTYYADLGNTTPSQTIGQTISFSDVVAWRHKKHNFRFGGDIRRVHSDSIGGNNPLGSFTFTGFATAGSGSASATNGSSFADFLLGLPESTGIQAGKYKDYLRENVYDWYAVDDWRLKTNFTVNASLRYEYFGPYTEKYGHLVNLDHTANFSSVTPVTPGATGFPNSLVNPDYTMYSPRLGLAWTPKLKSKLFKSVVIRGGYGVNYNTGQYATFAKLLSHQPGPPTAPFSATQTNSVPLASSSSQTGCITITPANPTPITKVNGLTTLTLANGFGCSSAYTVSSDNWAVDKNYRLGMVQIYNLNMQKTIGPSLLLNVGYNGAKALNLDVVGNPNPTPTVLSAIPGAAPFDYETSGAGEHSNSLVVSLQQRQRKGIALGATYTYLHAIDNASGVGGAVGSPVQNFYRLDLEEGNSSFDQRHNLTGNWLIELPFGPNREFLNKGGFAAKALDGFSISGNFTFATGTYRTPTYSGNQAEAVAGNTFTERPDRVFGVAIKGPGKLKEFFNPAAFTAPAGTYGTASQGSIEGPGTTSVSAALSKTVSLGGTSSFEARVQASNVFNTVQYSGINTTENSPNFGQVTSAAGMRSLLFVARYRF